MKERLYFVSQATVDFYGDIRRTHDNLMHLSYVVIQRDGDKWRCVKHYKPQYLNEVCHPNWIKLLFSEFHVYSLTPPINLDNIQICQKHKDLGHRREA